MVRSKGKNIKRTAIRKNLSKTRNNNKRVSSYNRSSVRGGYTINNSATRRGRSTTTNTKKKRMTNRLNNKKKGTTISKNNNNRRRNQQKKKKKPRNVASLISPTTSNLIRPSEEFHCESIFGTTE